MPPPFSPDKPHLGLACLAAYAQAEGLSVEVCDMNLELHAAADEQERTLWHRTRDAACYWNYPGSVLGFLARHEAAIDDLLEQLLSRCPKVVGLSCHMTNTYLALLIAERLRRRGPDELVIVAGGPSFFVSTDGGGGPAAHGYPDAHTPAGRAALERHLALLDGIVVGEGEAPLAEIGLRVREGAPLEGVKNLIRVRGDGAYSALEAAAPPRTLAAYPWPTFAPFDLARYTERELPVLFSRGCIKRCAGCTERYHWGAFRARPAEQILEELHHHVERLQIRTFAACDMLLNADLDQLDRLCDLLIEAGLRIRCSGQVLVREEMTAARFEKMRAAGFTMLIFGVESGSQRIIDLTRKGHSRELAARNLADCHRAGIRTAVNIVVGFPTESEEDFQQTLEFLRENRPQIDDVMVLATFEIFHHTEIAAHPERYQIPPEQVRGLGQIFSVADWSDASGNTLTLRQERLQRVQALMAELGLAAPLAPTDRLSHLADLERYRDLDALHGLLQDHDERVRGEAVAALGRIDDATSVAFLHPTLERAAFHQLPTELQEGLAGLRARFIEINDRVAFLEQRRNVAALRTLLIGADRFARRQATAALGRLDGDRGGR